MNSSVHVDIKKDILVLGESLTQSLYSTTITTEAKYPTNFTESGKRFALDLDYNGGSSVIC